MVYELDTWSRDLNSDIMLKDCLFGGVKLAKNTDPDEYIYGGYGIRFDWHSLSSLPNFDWGENVIIFGVDICSPVHVDNKKKDISILGKGPT